MPSEIRYINFTTEDFLGAARLYYRRTGEKLPGEIVAVTFRDDCRVALLVGRTGVDKTSEVVLDHSKVGSILVFYCLNNNVPLPARSIRMLKIVGAHISLMVTRNIPAERLEKIRIELPE